MKRWQMVLAAVGLASIWAIGWWLGVPTMMETGTYGGLVAVLLWIALGTSAAFAFAGISMAGWRWFSRRVLGR